MAAERTGAYGPDNDFVDYILGITYEIWEERGVDLIHQYYGEDCIVWGLDGITHGAKAVVDATWATLAAFPDRRLINEHVIWSGNRREGLYSSHRLLSTGTNEGPSIYGPATGNRIRMTNIADCFVEDGVITREWLVRDSMMFATQLGADVTAAARDMRQARTQEHQEWLDSEHARVRAAVEVDVAPADPIEDPEAFARAALQSVWLGDVDGFARAYAPYCVLHRSPFDHHSGREALFAYYASLREVLGRPSVSVDHVAHQPLSTNGVDIAVRWTVAGEHEAPLYGAAATGKPLFIMGVSHWRCIAGRITSERTVFDDLALLSQVVDS
ncbi:MAG: ester cyclase [Pseudomonadota bacterium]